MDRSSVNQEVKNGSVQSSFLGKQILHPSFIAPECALESGKGNNWDVRVDITEIADFKTKK